MATSGLKTPPCAALRTHATRRPIRRGSGTPGRAGSTAGGSRGACRHRPPIKGVIEAQTDRHTDRDRQTVCCAFQQGLTDWILLPSAVILRHKRNDLYVFSFFFFFASSPPMTSDAPNEPGSPSRGLMTSAGGVIPSLSSALRPGASGGVERAREKGPGTRAAGVKRPRKLLRQPLVWNHNRAAQRSKGSESKAAGFSPEPVCSPY